MTPHDGGHASAIRSDIAALVPAMQTWRRQIHARPETAYEEFATSDLVATLLGEWGLEVGRGLAGTGVVGTLRGSSGGPAIGLRADMDALDVEEGNTFPHRSATQGKMHACGHDGHTAMLLGAALFLSLNPPPKGTIHFIFQPAEENVAGGKRMIDDGLFSLYPVDAVFGMHNMPGVPEGHIVATPGALMASADFFKIVITGRGAHGAWPHQGIDVITIGAELVSGFNQILARAIDPLAPVVLSVTRFSAGQTSNVLPEQAVIEGTTRTFDEAVQRDLETRMRRLCDGVAAAHGARIELTYDRRYPPLINHAAETAFAADVAARIVGRTQVLQEHPPIMGAEDFAWMLREQRGAYVWLGAGDGAALHSPNYDFNDDLLSVGAAFWVELAERWLGEPA